MSKDVPQEASSEQKEDPKYTDNTALRGTSSSSSTIPFSMNTMWEFKIASRFEGSKLYSMYDRDYMMPVKMPLERSHLYGHMLL